MTKYELQKRCEMVEKQNKELKDENEELRDKINKINKLEEEVLIPSAKLLQIVVSLEMFAMTSEKIVPRNVMIYGFQKLERVIRELRGEQHGTHTDL